MYGQLQTHSGGSLVLAQLVSGRYLGQMDTTGQKKDKIELERLIFTQVIYISFV